MTDVLYPSPTRRFMTETGGLRRYHRSAARAVAVARGGALRVAMGKGWTRHPERVAIALRAAGASTAGARS